MTSFTYRLVAGLSCFVILVVGLVATDHRWREQVLGTTDHTDGKIIFDFFAVGQGDCALIQLPNGDDVLIDGGPDSVCVGKIGLVLPFYDRTIELMIISHPHSDHINGLIDVVSRYQIGQVWLTANSYTADYQFLLDELTQREIPLEHLQTPSQIKWFGDVSFSILAPTGSPNQRAEVDLNNSSLVVQVRYQSTTALFMGDYENEELLATSTVRSDIIKIGHHGSTNANDQAFLAAVAPRFAVISVGTKNNYGHPHYRTIRQLEKIGAVIWRTDRQGDLRLISNGTNIWQP